VTYSPETGHAPFPIANSLQSSQQGLIPSQSKTFIVLNSWKEIAIFLKVGVRTAQRWEAERQLPVHRVGVGPRSPVFALGSELIEWARSYSPAVSGSVHTRVRASVQRARALGAQVQHSRELLRRRLDALRGELGVLAQEAERYRSIYTKASGRNNAQSKRSADSHRF